MAYDKQSVIRAMKKDEEKKTRRGIDAFWFTVPENKEPKKYKSGWQKFLEVA